MINLNHWRPIIVANRKRNLQSNLHDNAKVFQFINVGLDKVTVIDMNDGLVQYLILDSVQVRAQHFGSHTAVKMFGKMLHGIQLFGFFVQLVNDISQKAAFRCKNAVSYISGKSLSCIESCLEILSFSFSEIFVQ